MEKTEKIIDALEEFGKITAEETSNKRMENSLWFFRNYERLVESFGGQNVAVYQCDIIDSDEDVKTLAERVRKEYPEESRHIYIGFVPTERNAISLTNMD